MNKNLINRPTPLEIGNLPDSSDLAKVMRALCPLPGTTYSKYMSVTLAPGRGIEEHKHKQYTVLYYPAACEPVIVTPTAGLILCLPPDTLHQVLPVKTERKSVAMLVDNESS